MKTGRNESCPCGSGKKHKHCCLELRTVAKFTPSKNEPNRATRRQKKSN